MELSEACEAAVRDCATWLGFVSGWEQARSIEGCIFEGLPSSLVSWMVYIAELAPLPDRLSHYRATAEDRAEALSAQRALDGVCEAYPALRAVLDAEIQDPTGKTMLYAIQGLRGRYDDPALRAARPYRSLLAELRVRIGTPPPPFDGAPLRLSSEPAVAAVMETLSVIPELRWPMTSAASATEALLGAASILSQSESEAYRAMLHSFGIVLAGGAHSGPIEDRPQPRAVTSVAVNDAAARRSDAARRGAETRARRQAEELKTERESLAEEERRREVRREAARRAAATRAARAEQKAAEEEDRRVKRQLAARRAAATRAANRKQPGSDAELVSAATVSKCPICSSPLVLGVDVAAGIHAVCAAAEKPTPAAPPERRGLLARLRRNRPTG